MSHTLGSNINSPLFMDDPVPFKNKNQSVHASSERSFFVKGSGSDTQSKDATSDSYQHLGGEDDVFIIKTPGGSYQLHRKALKETLYELKKNSHTLLRQLTSDTNDSFKSIVEALRLLYNSQALYDIVLTDIRDIFADIKEIKPGTVAAFFIGCFNDDQFPGPIGCNPKCTASLPPANGTPGYTTCEDLILIYADDTFSSLNERQSSHAYIYVGDTKFQGFTPEDIVQLKNAGVERASIIYGNHDGTYREVTSALTLAQLPLKQKKDETPPTQTQAPQTNNTTTTSSSNTGAGIVIAIIIIVIIIVVLLLLYRNSTQ